MAGVDEATLLAAWLSWQPAQQGKNDRLILGSLFRYLCQRVSGCFICWWAVLLNALTCIFGGLASEMGAYAEHHRDDSEQASFWLNQGCLIPSVIHSHIQLHVVYTVIYSYLASVVKESHTEVYLYSQMIP